MSRRHAARLSVIVAVAAVAAVTALTVPASRQSDAAYPGSNGRIAYAYGESYGYGGGAIWSANADGSAPTTLTKGAHDNSPAYSPNGSRIAFEREEGVAVMNADGSGLTQILSGKYSYSSKPEWKSEYPKPGHPSEKVPFVKITNYTETWQGFHSPSFSPDGSQLAVGESHGEYVYRVICEVEEAEGSHCVSGYEGGYYHYEYECIDCRAGMITVNSSTGAVTGNVTPVVKGVVDYDPAYSPDGKIAFSRYIESAHASSIFAVSSPGAMAVRVTNGPQDYEPDFSPDGSRIAFNHGGEVGLVGAGGGPITLLSIPVPPDASHGYSGSPVFSPDGSKIALERRVSPKVGKAEWGIYTIGTDGNGLTKVIGNGSAPSWQPLAVPPPPPTPPTAKSKTGKGKLDKKGRVKVGAVVCGSTPCALKVLSAKLKAGKKRCGVKVTLAKKLAPGATAKVGVKVAGKCLAALKEAGKGRLVIRVRISDGLGKHVLALKKTVVPAHGHDGDKGKAHK
jgi:Tol biopolymer transport system component